MPLPGTPHKEHEIRCVTSDEVTYEVINLRKDVQSVFGTILTTSKTYISNGVIDADFSNATEVHRASNGLMNVRQEGTFTLAVIRVTGKDGYSPSMSRGDLTDGIFDDEMNLVSNA